MVSKKNKKRGSQAHPVVKPTQEPPNDELLAFPVVGVGASAGGLDAFTQLLKALPVDTGMAFVLVQHLSPTHESALAEILSRVTQMPVTEVRSESKVEPNHVYVIPPGQGMILSGKALQLLPLEGRVKLRPVDRFFRSLAEELGLQAIGVVLSGTATDGTIGLEAIKAEGGITFAQDSTAEQDGMPHSAISSGCVDFVLPPDEIARELARIGKHPYVVPSSDEPNLTQVLHLLRHGTGIDFSNYKYNTIYRRVTRRMVLQKIEDLKDYIRFLKENPAEVTSLYYDLLIGVTSFFRNPEAFEALKDKVFPRLIKSQAGRDPVRIWSVGCSTGQEAYSLAMAFMEFAEAVGSSVPVRIFATDLNERGVETARTGFYPKDIAQDVSAERLRRFFVEVEGGYRINKAIREVCVFSRHNVISDPPFSQMDLICCRNLLIHLEPVLQQKIVPILHYALKPHGVLWLGASETIGSYRNLFELEDAKQKIYAKKPGPKGAQLPLQESGVPRTSFTPITGRPSGAGSDLHREAEHFLVSRFAPPSVLVSKDLQILKYSGDTGAYLAPAPGEASLNLFKMLREGLLVGVRQAVLRAGKENALVREEGLRVKSNGGYRELTVEVVPLKSSGGMEGGGNDGGFLVLFHEAHQTDGSHAVRSEIAPASQEPQACDPDNARLQHELSATREYLQSVIEQQEAANEELQSANEEAQSSNEELQSINEELETSKEEIQSSNEELATVNDELNNRNAELNSLNSDLVNLLASIQVAIVMLGPDLRVRRFTPMAENLLNLVSTDIGRPVGAIKLKFDLPDLEALLRQVLNTVSIHEREVQDTHGHWYSLRLRPYKSLENKIDGVVMIMVDIDLQKRAQEYIENIVKAVSEPLIVLDANLRVRTANDSFRKTFQVTPEELKGRPLYELGNGQWNIPDLHRLLLEVLKLNEEVKNLEVEHEFPHIGKKALLLNARQVPQVNGLEASILLAIEDVTERKLTEAERKETLRHEQVARKEADSANRVKENFIATLSHELRTPLNAVLGWIQLLIRGAVKPEEVQEAYKVIERSAKHQAQLVSDLLDVSRIASGKLKLDMQPVNLYEIINDTIEGKRKKAALRKVEVRKELDTEIGPFWGDPTRLQQVIWNLLSNAIKFTPEGGTVTVLLERTPQRVEITVMDTGIGIEAAMIPHLFERFWQADSSSARNAGGMGLGLSIVREIVELHGGNIWAKSPGRGQGATFIVSLPLATEKIASEAKCAATVPDVQESSWADLSGVEILLVDDDTYGRELVRRIFEERGGTVITASSAAEGMSLLCKKVPDVLVSDIGMAGEDGYSFLHRVRSLSSAEGGDVPAIALTAFARPEDRTRALVEGFQAHVSKPLDSLELVATVSSLLGRTGRSVPKKAD